MQFAHYLGYFLMSLPAGWLAIKLGYKGGIITGLLIVNGTHFRQIGEGSPLAIDDLVERLRRDPRHSGIEIRDQRGIDERSFPDWSMELVRVSAGYFEAKDTVSDRLPETVSEPVRERVIQMTEAISGTVRL